MRHECVLSQKFNGSWQIEMSSQISWVKVPRASLIFLGLQRHEGSKVCTDLTNFNEDSGRDWLFQFQKILISSDLIVFLCLCTLLWSSATELRGNFVLFLLRHFSVFSFLPRNAFRLKPLPKLGRAADQFGFMGAHSWDFTKQSYFFSVIKGLDYDFKLSIFS